MSLISFDIIFNNIIENDSIKLLPECEFQQLKLMICGKYKIYDLNNIYIYYKGNLIIDNDSTKLKNIFKNKKIKLEISEKPLIKNSNSSSKYLCSCETFATFICDNCDEFLCEACIKKKKHTSHINKIIKIQEYKNYFKSNINNLSEEIEKNILNDEPYLFFQFWNYDINSEIAKIDTTFEFVKKELEDIKKLLIDYIISFSENNNYEELNKQIDFVIKQYMNINIDNDLNIVLEQKRKIFQLIKLIFSWYEQLKNQLFNYHKAIKDIQIFNQILIKETKDKYHLMQKKYDFIPSIQNNLSNGNISDNNNNNKNSLNTDFMIINGRKSNNSSNNSNNINNIQIAKMNRTETESYYHKNNNNNNNFENSFKGLKDKINTMNIGINTNIFNQSSPLISVNKSDEKMLFQLKDKQTMIIFSLKYQTFKEKNFIDKSNFSKEIKENDEIIQLNLANKLFLLSGKKNNKFYYYNYDTNSINYLGNTLYSHYYGAIVYCSKYNMIYLIGGENQIQCEVAYLNISKKLDWKSLPNLNEERQKFASMYFNEYIYVFFGYSVQKGNNLCSIERININTNENFEIVYVNELITLSSLACVHLVDKNENENENILLLGGYDGKNYLDSSLILNVKEMKIREWDVIIPNIDKYNQFLFHKESTFIDYNSNVKLIYDINNNVHLISKDSYEVFSEVQ